MSDKKHGNKEAKKPKKAKPLVDPLAASAVAVPALVSASDRMKKKK